MPGHAPWPSFCTVKLKTVALVWRLISTVLSVTAIATLHPVTHVNCRFSGIVTGPEAVAVGDGVGEDSAPGAVAVAVADGWFLVGMGVPPGTGVCPGTDVPLPGVVGPAGV